jgi:AcrR family transcriptional regulator
MENKSLDRSQAGEPSRHAGEPSRRPRQPSREAGDSRHPRQPSRDGGEPSRAHEPSRVGEPQSHAQRAVERSLAERRAAYTDEVRRLVAATFVLIERTGELEPRVGDIVREAGLSNQAFYRHFPSKQALLVAVLDEGIRILASYLEHRMQAVESPTAKVREWVRGLLEQALSPAGARATRPFVLARTRLAEAYPDEVAESERQLTALVREAIRAAVAAGELPNADPEGDAETLYHQAMGWLQARLLEGRPPHRRGAERLVEFALHGLLRGAAAPAPLGSEGRGAPSAPPAPAASESSQAGG